MLSVIGKLIFRVVTFPVVVLKWVVELVVGSVIRVVIFILIVVLFGYIGLDLLGIIDSPYLEPIKSGFKQGEKLEPTQEQ